MVGSTPAAGVVPPPHTRYSSILLGVEGCAPGKRSPFGTVHQASGRSNPVSVRGSRKWRAFAANFKHLERGVNADLVIPMDLGGMRATVTKVGPRLFCRAEDPFWECDVMCFSDQHSPRSNLNNSSGCVISWSISCKIPISWSISW